MAERNNASKTLDVQSPEALQELQSDDQRKLLNMIDGLRDLGIDKYDVELPQLVVIGDQSSGKSSVLEAISGVRFPSDPGTCTTFATEVAMRKGPEWSCQISVKGENKDLAFENIQSSCLSPQDVPDQIMKAKETIMKICTIEAKEISDITLHLGITGPQVPPLTLFDLPGIVHYSDRPSDATNALSLINKYIHNSQAIILTVISAMYERQLQEALKIAETVDPTCERTFGIITKPDQAIEQACRDEYISYVDGSKTRYKQEWHVLRNRGEDQKEFTPAQRDQHEKEFFSHGAWSNIPKDRVGAAELRARLSEKLYHHILRAYQGVKVKMRASLLEAQEKMDRLGKPRPKVEDQRALLNKLGQEFHLISNYAVKGIYHVHNDFFCNSPQPQEGIDHRCLRAAIHAQNEQFAKIIHTRGHRWKIVHTHGGHVNELLGQPPEMPQPISIEEYQAKIEKRKVLRRGDEPTGTYNPGIIQELFREQSAPWRKLALTHLEDVIDLVENFLDKLARFLAGNDETLHESIRNHLLNSMGDIKKRMESILTQILTPLEKGPLITFDPCYGRNMEKRKRFRMSESIKHKFTSNEDAIREVKSFDELASMGWLKNDAPEATTSQYEILDTMEMFYEHSRRQFIDNMTSLVIEGGLLMALPEMFSPLTVAQMSSEDVSAIASESEDTVATRNQLDVTIKTLEAGLKLFKLYTYHKAPARASMGKFPAIKITSRATSTGSLSAHSSSSQSSGGNSSIGIQSPASSTSFSPSHLDNTTTAGKRSLTLGPFASKSELPAESCSASSSGDEL